MEQRPIPDERDQIDYPPRWCFRRPDLRCEEHAGQCDLLHDLWWSLTKLEERVRVLEERK